jgi:drug/metabolite transporter (DMT)-like permease
MLSRLLVLAAALLFSTGGAAIKGTALSAWQTGGLRSAVAAVAMLALLPEARRGWSWRVWPVGLAYAFTLVSYVQANKLTTSANAIFLQSTAPAYLLVLSPLVLHEKLKRRDLIFTLALAGGMALFFMGVEKPAATAPNPSLGNLWAVASGASYALTLTGLRWMAHRSGHSGAALATVVAGNLLAFAICSPGIWPVSTLRAFDAAVLIYLGVFQIGLSYVCLTRGMRHVPAFETSTLLLLEPVCNPVWTWLFHGEKPSSQSLAGGAVILAATVAKMAWERRETTPDPSATAGTAAHSA